MGDDPDPRGGVVPPQPDTPTLADTHGNCCANADARAHEHGNCPADGYGNAVCDDGTDIHAPAYGDAHRHTHPHQEAHGDKEAHGDAHRHADPHQSAHGHPRSGGERARPGLCHL
jgi:hypothetical protein